MNQTIKKTNDIPQDDTQQLDLIKASVDEKQTQISQIDLEIKNSNEELEKLKNDTIAQVKDSISKADQNLDTLDSNLKSLDESANINKDQNKSVTLSQIEEKINLNKDEKKKLEKGKKQIEQSIDKCIVKANSNGKIKVNLNLQPGVVLQPGTMVADVVPNSTNFKVDLVIQTKDVANISEGSKIKYSFESLPYREYGFLEGKLESISPDSNVNNETGVSCFIGEGSLNSNALHSNKGEKSSIKPGMVCEAKIITRSEKMLYYLLEQIGFKNK
ncbi:HlyD family efflux transporter periplasmic adaptor subunit [Paraclostridium bifermentans]|uniref:HlyD family efflux transporter periplasmic adaptor subunit n=1 Tax=Paraclostridium bifermentans TaxID=1490 RepID=UPI0021C30507|nr:HlyD family efflux transporter periplasmic adaptor subunit [Paraclostridium bifermentans]GKZ04731.1 hypothetical protein ANS014_31650 [Paraclostridium bifermentans]GKZ07553.1 hypothetical protein ANS015_24360 [Paraclostridium bifermentans]